ncbi:MAG: hypothetical protein R6U98_17805, partial [Pirellulaceae bacterium]
ASGKSIQRRLIGSLPDIMASRAPAGEKWPPCLGFPGLPKDDEGINRSAVPFRDGNTGACAEGL